MNCLQRILMLLIGVCLTLVVGMASSYAAVLNDIRVGEYPTHTRIVFELSETAPIKQIALGQPGQMIIDFAATQPRLKRKIPIERSQRITEIQLWHRQTQLSAMLTFAFEHFRHEIIELKNPSRIVVDVYKLAAAPQPSLASMPEETASTPSESPAEDRLTIPPNDTQPLAPLPSANTVAPQDVDQSATTAPKTDIPTTPPEPITEAESTPDVPQKAPTDSVKDPSPAEDTHPVEQEIQGLQFYLVIGLVILTIVILMLLLVMLLSKQRWTDDQSDLNASEYLQRQDDKIAALDTQIHEQLKRYDEA